MAAARIEFVPYQPRPDYLRAYHRIDIGLDTLPYNAHTTGSDALWAGLPVLTCAGSTFPGRVGASLLSAVGLPELIAPTPDEYEKLAVALARDPERLGQLRERLVQSRMTAPLFDTARFARDIESLYLSASPIDASH